MDKIKNAIVWFWHKLKGFWPWYKGLYQGRAWYTKTLVALASCFVAFLLYLGAVDINLFWLFGKSPGWLDISKHETNEASEIYSADGVKIGKYFNENRTPVKYQDVTPLFWKALIDTEDERFYSHWGVDPMGLLGAVKDAATGHGGRGASTITQQLAKNMFRVRTKYSTGLVGKIPGVKILVMKTKEWITAMKLELFFAVEKGRNEGKKEILVQYANTVDFGSNSYGIKTASKTYFDKEPKDLTADEAAILVGMLKATTYYNPKLNPENSKARRNVVLQNMVSHGDLTSDEYKKFSQLDIKLNFRVEENYDGQAKYFREAVAKYLSKWCEEEGYDLYTSGLKIYTTIDTRMQKYAEAAAHKQMKQVQQNFNNHWGIYRQQDKNWLRQEPWQDENHQVIPNFIQGIAERQPFYKELMARFPNNPDSVNYYYKEWVHPVKVFDYDKGTIVKNMTSEDSIKYMTTFMHCAFVAMEPQTGAVKAWVGDIDFDMWKYDKVTAQRQPGSTFKLFVYTEAMNQGLTPCDKRRDEYISMEVYDKQKHQMVRWTPSNANGSFSGDSMPLKSAFAKSINSVAVRLGQEMGIKRIIETAYKMGIYSETSRRFGQELPLDETPSLALGSSDVNLLDMATAYSVIADNGKHHDPVLVTKIVDREGKEVYTAPTTDEQVIPYKSAFLMQQLLQGGMREPGGTSQSLWGYVGNFRDTEFGGKTGTTNNHSDAWFMCVSPKLVCGAWVGGEYRSIHFRTGALGQGSRTALPICGYFMQSVFSDPNFQQYHGKFDKPHDDDITRDMYICDSYYPHAKVDTTAADSLAEDEMIELDENGQPMKHEDEFEELDAAGSEKKTTEEAAEKKDKKEAAEKKKKHAKKEEVITLDDL